MGKPRMTRQDKWKQRRCVMKYREFKDKARSLGLDKELEGNALICKYIIEMPKSWSKKKKEKFNGKLHENKPDVDNCDKGMMDILKEDSHISLSCSCKVWCKKGMIIMYDSLQEFLINI